MIKYFIKIIDITIINIIYNLLILYKNFLKNIYLILFLFLLSSCTNLWDKTNNINNNSSVSVATKNITIEEINKNIKTVNTEIENIEVKKCVKSEDVKIYSYMYHYIRDKTWDNPNAGFIRNAVITENFEAQMKKFQELEQDDKIQIIFLSQLEDFHNKNCFPHKNLVIFTSDDWWDDNFINLYPIAKKYNIKFHLSMISNFVKDERYDNFMTNSELKTVSDDNNFEIIWHTYSHLDLRTLNDFYMDRELCQSKYDLEKRIWKDINTLIYPAWKYNNAVIDKAKKCNYTYGFTTQWWINNLEDIKNNPFILKRIRVSRSTTAKNLTHYFEE